VGIPGVYLRPAGFRCPAAPQATHGAGRDAWRIAGHHGTEADNAGERPADPARRRSRHRDLLHSGDTHTHSLGHWPGHGRRRAADSGSRRPQSGPVPGRPSRCHDHCLAYRTFDPAGTGPGRAAAGPGGRPDRDGRAAADRSRTARHRGAQHRHHRDPGRRGQQGLRRPSRRGAQRPGCHRGHQQGDAIRTAADGDRAAAHRAGPRAGAGTARPGARPGRHRAAGRHDPGRGRAGRRGLARQPGAAPGGHRPVGVPHHPGGGHQRGPPCRHQPVPCVDRPAGRAAVDRGHRQRARRQRDRDRLRDHRHARTRRAARRRLLGRPRPGGGFRVAARLPVPAPAR
jgi:hypothetical protein